MKKKKEKIKYTGNFLKYKRQLHIICISLLMFFLCICFFNIYLHESSETNFSSIFIFSSLFILLSYIYYIAHLSAKKMFYIYKSGIKTHAKIIKIIQRLIDVTKVEIIYEYKTPKGLFKGSRRLHYIDQKEAGIKCKINEKIKIIYNRHNHSESLLITPSIEKKCN